MGLFRKLKDAILAKIGLNDSSNSPATPPPAASNAPNAAPPPAPPKKLSAAELAGQLDALAAKSPEKLAWRSSIVDLMKLVGMDGSFAECKEMALDLGYPPADIESKGSAEMNVWLHQKVLEKLSADTDGDLRSA